MLKESLPISKIKEKLKKLENLLKDKILENDFIKKKVDSQNPPEVQVEGANLLSKSESQQRHSLGSKDIKSYYGTPIFINMAQIIIISITLIFLLLSVINLYFNLRIKSLKSTVSQKADQISTMIDSLEEMDYYAQKVSLLKEYEASTQNLLPLINLFLNSSGSMEFNYFELNSAAVSFTASTPSPVAFSIAADKYLQREFVENIVLEAAHLDPDENVYQLEVKVNLK